MNSTSPSNERPFVAVLASIFENIQEIVRSEVRLTKAEAREEIAEIARGAGWLVAGMVSAFFAISFILGAGFFALSYIVPHWVAALIVAAGLAVISGLSFAMRASIPKPSTQPRATLSAAQPEEITA